MPMNDFDQKLSEVAVILAEKIGLDIATIGYKSLEIAVNRRMIQLELNSISRFSSLLRSDLSELQILIEMIVVPETWFYRDIEPFNLLQEIVKSRFLLETIRPLRILSIPSSTGEEPYSISIALKEINFPLEYLTIDAVDISSVALQKAKKGIYSKSSFRGVDEGIISRYFIAVEREQFKLDEGIKRTVNFSIANLVEPFFLNNKLAYDIIFCRNIIIYLDSKGRETAVKNLKKLLKPDGLLFSGHTEVMFFSSMGFKSVSRPRSFALNFFPLPSNGVAGSRVTGHRTEQSNSGNGQRATHNPQPTTHTRQRVTGNRQPTTDDAEMSGYDHEYIRELANRGDLITARKKCEENLVKDPTSKDLICLLGEINLANGLVEEAENNFLKVLYLDPSHIQAIVHISLLYDQKGDTARSETYKERLKRATERQR
jgi:chemotaxis protein methyltransferase WspC